MRRHGSLFEEICAFENLLLAAQCAQQGKRFRHDVLRFNLRREDHLHRLRRALIKGEWHPSPHRHFRIFEPKERWISAAPYRDRVVHHAVCNVIGPLIDRRLIHDCWANRVGKGSHRAVLRYQSLAHRYRFVLKADIRKYFPSVDHQLLRGQFRRRFKDQGVLALLDRIVDTGEVPEPFDRHFPGDDLLTPLLRPKGLPIGNLTSQLWANLYLDRFDHWVKEELRVPAYLRFVDDFLVLSDSRETLERWRRAIERQLGELRLTLHGRKSVIRRTDEGVPFLGYVVWPDRIRIRGETVRRYRKRLRGRKNQQPDRQPEQKRSLAAWRGHVSLAGTFRRSQILKT